MTVRAKPKTSLRNRLLIYGALLLGAFLTLYPFVIMVMNSFKPGAQTENYPAAWPSQWILSGYRTVFHDLNISQLFQNSVIISGSTTLMNIIFDTLAAYALAKVEFPGSQLLFKLILASMMIPGIILLVPTYTMMYHLGWVNTFLPLIIPASVSSYNIFLIRQFMKNIPDALVEAGRLDGCNEMGVLWNIILPMSKPAIAAVAILTFMGGWNDLFGPLLYLHSEKLFTVQLGLWEFQSQIPGQHVEELWAATTLITVPVVAVFLIFQKQFVSAFTNIGLK